jgi:hypothetical protein
LNKAVDIVVVYKANPESLQTVLGLLRKEGFNPTTLEGPSGAAAISGCGKATYLFQCRSASRRSIRSHVRPSKMGTGSDAEGQISD